MRRRHLRGRRRAERGMVMVVILFVATAIAALATISSGRVVAEIRMQAVLESSTQAYNDAVGQLQLAMNVLNHSAYDDQNHNLELQEAVAGDYGGTAAGDTPAEKEWLRDPDGVTYGYVRGTEVRCYKAADYLRRLAKLKAEPAPTDPNLDTDSARFFVIEALAEAGEQTRMVSALVRENQPFSAFVFFQNRHPLGVSGAPRGLIHANDKIEFYFPDGDYVDSVSAVNGFGYEAGATPENTSILTGNPESERIDLEAVDFAELAAETHLYKGDPGLDAEIMFYPSGKVRIRPFAPPTFTMETRTISQTDIIGYNDVWVQELQQVQIGTTPETRIRQVAIGEEPETYTVTIDDYEWQEVTKTRNDPIYERQTVTGTRWVKVFQPYDADAGGGTAVSGGGETVPGEWVWVQEEYQYETDVIIGYNEVTYTDTEQVWIGSHEEERVRMVTVYADEEYTVQVPVYEEQLVDVLKKEPIYETTTWEEDFEIYVPRQQLGEEWVDLKLGEGTIFIDGRITSLEGQINGRASVISTDKVRITDDLVYVDDDGDTAMLNGSRFDEPYLRNSDYEGNSTFGIIAKDDILFTQHMDDESEVNGTLMSTTGRVGIDGFAIEADGDPTKNYYLGMTAEEIKHEQAYDWDWWTATRRFRKDSLRRMGGIISNDRIIETYIRPRSDGTSYVDSGFKRGKMKFDISLLFNPPPNFVEVPRPVMTYYAPVFFVRGEEN